MTKAEKIALLKMIEAEEARRSPLEFARQKLWIRQEGTGALIRLEPNANQIRHYQAKQAAIKAGKSRRFLILKARRMGFTTWEQAESFHLVTTKQGQKAVTLAHTAPITEQIFKIAQQYYNALEDPPKIGDGFKREMTFPELKSTFYIGTAGAKGFGRGDTFDRVHGSEAAFWPGKPEEIDIIVGGLCEAARMGEVVLESTANGVGNWFYLTWRAAVAGKNDWTPLFYPWYDDPVNVLPFAEDEEFIYTEEEEQIAKAYDLSPEQMKWRRAKKKALGTIFDQEYPDSPEVAFIATGKCAFNVDILRSLLRVTPDPGPLTEAPPEVRKGLTLWHPPAEGADYAIGCDVGEGKGGDYSVAAVIDPRGRQCAVLRNNWWNPESFAKRVACLGEWYNMALLAPERNNHGHSVLNSLRNMHHYPRLYIYHDYDKRLGSQKVLGWDTNRKSRPLMLDELIDVVEKEEMQINDRVFLGECLTFADDGTGKKQATAGNHDDTVFAWAIAWQIRKTAALRPGSGTVQSLLKKQHEEAGLTRCDWCGQEGFDAEIGACQLCSCKPDGGKVTIIRHGRDERTWRKF